MFLTPAYIMGIAAVVAPVVFHLLRRMPRKRVPFSTLMFLEASPPEVTRRSRLDNWPLLLLRAFILILIAIAFARPFWRTKQFSLASVSNKSEHLILIDTSASMKREDLWNQVTEHFQSLLEDISEDEEIALAAFDRDITLHVSFASLQNLKNSQKKIALEQSFQELKPTWNETRIGTALMTAVDFMQRERVESSRSVQQKIHLITDLQQGAQYEELRTFTFPDHLSVDVLMVESAKSSNAGLQLIQSENSKPILSQQNPPVTIRVSNTAQSEKDHFVIQSPNVEEQWDLFVPEKQSRTLSLNQTEHAITKIQLNGDDHPFDNLLYLTPRPQKEETIVHFGNRVSDSRNDPHYFLGIAFPDTVSRKVNVRLQTAEMSWDPALFQQAGMIFITRSLSDEEIIRVQKFVQSGGVAVTSFPNVNDYPTLFALLESEPLPVQSVVAKDSLMMTDIDFNHALFQPFSDADYANFSKIQTWRYNRIDPKELQKHQSLREARWLARFDHEAPALLEYQQNNGRYLIFLTGWTPQQSQFALSSKFAAIWNQALKLSPNYLPPARQFFIGDSIVLADLLGENRKPIWLRTPDEHTISLKGKATLKEELNVPGIYRVELENKVDSTPAEEFAFAVNLPPRESQTSTLKKKHLEELGLPMGNRSNEQSADEQQLRQHKATELEQDQKLWRWLLLIALGLLAWESILAKRHCKVEELEPV